jgi:hypothetical protein
MLEFWDHLPESERLIADVLRQIILGQLPSSCKEKLTYNVPFFYGNKRICLIWPAAIKGGGVRAGVLLGFCEGYRLADSDNYLSHGTNKRIFYKVYQSVDEINEKAICKLLKEAVELDGIVKKRHR